MPWPVELIEEDRHDQERAPRPEETGDEVAEPTKEDAEAKGAGEESDRKEEVTMQPFIPAKELKQSDAVRPHTEVRYH